MSSRPLILVVNPGSSSRKYALFEGDTERARLHFEWVDDAIYCTITTKGQSASDTITIESLEEAAHHVTSILHNHHILQDNKNIDFIGLRIVAPGSYFLQDRGVDQAFTSRLETAHKYAPLHIEATLHELSSLQKQFPHTSIYGISDSAFHITKPEQAWNYGIDLELADRLEIKRFGYHGISVASVMNQVSSLNKAIICHLGSGASITAIENSQSKDTTMGYSPLEGLIMSTRSGSLDISAAYRLKKELGMSDEAFESYLNTKSGLHGLGGSSDIRQLLTNEKNGDHRARLALDTYVYNLQKAIGQMAAALNGVDSLIFTGTVGERSGPIRKRVVARLSYLGFSLDHIANSDTRNPDKVATIHDLEKSKPIYIIPAQEEKEIAQRVLTLAAE